MNQDQGNNKSDNTVKQSSTTPSGIEDKRSEEKKDTANADEEADTETANSSKPSKIWAWLERKFPQAQEHDLLTLFFTAVLTVSTVTYAIVAICTLREIRSGSIDTRNLAGAAQTQADAARAQVEPIIHLKNALKGDTWGSYHFEGE